MVEGGVIVVVTGVCVDVDVDVDIDADGFVVDVDDVLTSEPA